MPGPESPMGASRPEVNQFTPDQSQYVPPLQSWPPQQAHVPQFSTVPASAEQKHSVVLPWIFVALGLVLPLSALVVGIWACFKVRERGGRYLAIAVSGLGLFCVMLAIVWPQAKEQAERELSNPNGPGMPAPAEKPQAPPSQAPTP